MNNLTSNELYMPRNVKSKRISSWDQSGKNEDWVFIKKGDTSDIAIIEGTGCIRHLWFTVNCTDRYYLRKILLRIYWDQETAPSVEAPIGDFFGVGHGVANHYISLPFNMITEQNEPQKNAGMNCFLPMPFADGARFEIVNESNEDIQALYFYIDYEEMVELPKDAMRFHSCWHRAITDSPSNMTGRDKWKESINRNGDENYIIMEAKGVGSYIGCNMSIDHINPTEGFPWFGEGDDMIFIDGDKWPPTMHGTGTEDYFCAAWGFPSGKYDGPYHGISLACPINGVRGKDPWSTDDSIEPDLWYSGKWTFYRFHIVDPISFKKDIMISIEHGHANCHKSDFASTAYWYQIEPHVEFDPILSVEKRIPMLTKNSLREFVKTI